MVLTWTGVAFIRSISLWKTQHLVVVLASTHSGMHPLMFASVVILSCFHRNALALFCLVFCRNPRHPWLTEVRSHFTFIVARCLEVVKATKALTTSEWAARSLLGAETWPRPSAWGCLTAPLGHQTPLFRSFWVFLPWLIFEALSIPQVELGVHKYSLENWTRRNLFHNTSFWLLSFIFGPTGFGRVASVSQKIL